MANLGLVGLYRKFVPFFADITSCLTVKGQDGLLHDVSGVRCVVPQ